MTEFTEKYRVTDLVRTCWACPAQWDGHVAHGARLYIRFRHGSLRADVEGVTVFRLDHGDGWAGSMSNNEMRALLDGVLDFS